LSHSRCSSRHPRSTRFGACWKAAPLCITFACSIPFTHAVELIRFALYGKINPISLAVVCGCTVVFMIGAILAYDPARYKQ
jgi:ABC-2 type transport system permease protein